MNRAELERLQAIVDALAVPVPWSLSTFVAALSAQRGRPIQLHPLEGPTTADTPTGLWVPSREADHIFYETATSLPHQEHIVCHELGHMVLRHQPDPERPGRYLHSRLFHQVAPELVEIARARTSYRDAKEQEAETFATLILRGATSRVRTGTAPPSPAALQWSSVLGFDS